MKGNITACGFKYGTSAGSLSHNLSGTYSNGSISASLTGLTAGTTYYYQAYLTVQGTGDYAGESKTLTGSVQNFKTSDPPAQRPAGWLELPSLASGSNQVTESLGSGANRNYSYLYDKTYYASLWVAYPLTRSHTEGNASTSAWRYNPNVNIPHEVQINVTGSSYPTSYNAASYARGHQCPNASRKCDEDRNRQTYYLTNQTPQLQQEFNGSIWGSLETAVRGMTSSTDTVYVVTGPCFRKRGGSETITYLSAAGSIKPESIPVPNYYWKALLKVKWNSDKTAIISASAIAFWYPHTDLREQNYNDSQYVVSVDQIESWTGFDLFANLPDSIESTAEQNTSLSTFTSFR